MLLLLLLLGRSRRPLLPPVPPSAPAGALARRERRPTHPEAACIYPAMGPLALVHAVPLLKSRVQLDMHCSIWAPSSSALVARSAAEPSHRGAALAPRECTAAAETSPDGLRAVCSRGLG